MAFLFGGSTFLWSLFRRLKDAQTLEDRQILLQAVEVFERNSWIASGLIVLTGIGNLGVFGAGLPSKNTEWGTMLAIKLVTVLLFILFSLLRTMLILRIRLPIEHSWPLPLLRLLIRLYASTALFLLLIIVQALSLAHG